MKEVSIIGVDLAKQVFQLHGATAEGEVVFRKKLSRKQFLGFMQRHPGCLVAMEACATAHYWARTLAPIGHEVRLIAPKFVKPYLKNQKTDMADAEAIAEAASRPTMRFVEVKTAEQQGLGMIFRLRDLLVGQRTQTINALRGHLAEFGLVAGKGRENIDKLRTALEPCQDDTKDLPPAVHHMAQLCFDQIDDLSRRIAELDARIAAASKRSRFAARLQKMPGIGPVTAMALAAFAPPMDTFRQGRDFSENSWLGRMLARKPRMLVAIALANKMARMLWAMITKDEEFRGGPLMAN